MNEDALVVEVGLGPGDFVFDGAQLPREKRARQPHPTKFLAHVYCAKRLDGSRCHLVRR